MFFWKKPKPKKPPLKKYPMPKYDPKPFVPPEPPKIDQRKEKDSSEKGTTSFDPEKDFMRTFSELVGYRTWDAWKDFIVMSACAISNSLDKFHFEEREARYLRTIQRYSPKEQQVFPRLFSDVVLALEENPEQDFLGDIYMKLSLGDSGLKQMFTPYSVCSCMSELTVDDAAEQVKKRGYIKLSDPCCGAGATLIAGVHAIRKQLEQENLNFQNHILVVGQDIDETVTMMCYIQLSLLGVAAYFKVGDALTEPISVKDTLENYWFTPMYFSKVWSMRRAFHQFDAVFGEERGE